MEIKAAVRRYFSPHNISNLLEPYPELYHRAKAFYLQRSMFSGKVFKGVRLSCYAKGKCTVENFADLGSGKGEVEVKTLYTCLNTGTERAMFLRLPNTRAEFPYTPRASGVGRVVRVGRKVSGLHPGDLVAGSFMHASVQSFSSDELIRIAPGLDIEEASMLHLCIIAMQGIRMGQVKEGQRVVVMGQGIIGRLATLLARALGSEEVICMTQSTGKLRNLKEQRGIAIEELKASDTIKGLEADVVIDATGNPEAIHTAMLAAREGGKVVLLGSNRGTTGSFDINGIPLTRGLSIVGAHIRNQHLMPPDIGLDYQGEARVIQKLIKDGRLYLAGVITSRVPWSALADYYLPKLSSDPGTCGVVVDWTSPENPRKANISSPSIEYLSLRGSIKPLKMALIGCGDIGTKNAAAIVNCNGFDLALVVDTNLSLARELAQKYHVTYTDDIDNVITDKTIDAALIAVPHFLHAPLSRQLACAGKHILVEKPLATSMDEGASMIRVAQENKVLLRTFLPYSYEPQRRMAKTLVDHGVLGPVMGVSISMLVDQSERYWYGGYSGRAKSDWRTRKEFSGGGFLLMNLVHVFDYLFYITGIRIKTVFAQYDTLYHSFDVEDTIGLTFRGQYGEIGTVSGCSAVRGSGNDITRIWGENGQIVMDGNHLKFYSVRQIGEYRSKRWHTMKMKPRENRRVLFLDDFRQQIQDGCQTDLAERGYVALATIMAAYKSGELGRPVDVDSLIGP